jgi:hypothetical protein
MRLHIQDVNPRNDWESTLSVSRDEVIHRIFADNWHEKFLPGRTLMVCELASPFTLRFIEEQESTDPRFYVPVGIDVMFNFDGRANQILLDRVNMGSCRYLGMGSSLLSGLVRTAMDLHADSIFIEPGLQGSSYWLRRGALLQQWPDCELESNWGFDLAIESIIDKKTGIAVDWAEGDLTQLRDIYAAKNYVGLNMFVARDDLFVRKDLFDCKTSELIPMPWFLMANREPQMCKFDLKNPWTQKCLKDRVGLDVVAECAKQHMEPIRRKRIDALRPTSPQPV